MPIGDFINGYRTTVRRPDEIVTAILVPRPAAGARGRFVKLGARRYLVISIVMAAAVLAADDAGIDHRARASPSAPARPLRSGLTALEAALVGRPLAEAADIVAAEHLAALSPIDDIRASGAFRQAAALGLVRDLLAGFAAERERRAA